MTLRFEAAVASASANCRRKEFCREKLHRNQWVSKALEERSGNKVKNQK